MLQARVRHARSGSACHSARRPAPTALFCQLRMLHGSGMHMSMRGAPGRSKEDIMEEIRRLQAALLSHDGSRAPDTKDN